MEWLGMDNRAALDRFSKHWPGDRHTGCQEHHCKKSVHSDCALLPGREGPNGNKELSGPSLSQVGSRHQLGPVKAYRVRHGARIGKYKRIAGKRVGYFQGEFVLCGGIKL